MTDPERSSSGTEGLLDDSGGGERGRQVMTARVRWTFVALFALGTLLFDQISKRLMLGSLTVGRPVAVLGPLRWNLAFNTGMAFSRGANAGPVIGFIALAITVVMLVLARRNGSRLQLTAIGVIIGGALGNVVDRLLRVGELGSPIHGGFMSGAVVDFIDVQFWPIFNVADMAVVVGGLVLALSMFFVPEHSPAADADPSADEADPVAADRSPDDRA